MTARRLRALRLRITLLISLLAVAIVAVFATLVIRADRGLRDEQIAATLLIRTIDGGDDIAIEDGGGLADVPNEPVADDLVFAVRPLLTDLQVLRQRGLLDELPAPSPDDLRGYIETTFAESGADEQDFLLFNTGVFRADQRDDAYQAFLTDPPQPLVDEAEEWWYSSQAEAQGISLEPDPVIYLGPGSSLTPEQADAAVLTYLGGDIDGMFAIEGTDSLVARGTPLQDVDGDRGAVLAIADTGPSDEAHQQFRLRVLSIAAALVALGTVAAWFVGGRTMAPAAQALGQQERFLADAAHELRTPVTAIRTTADAATGQGDDAIRRIRRISTLAAGASDLTDDLLTLARMDADRLDLRLRPTRLDLLVEATLDRDDRFTLDASEVVVEIDTGLMTRAIDNLIQNAIRHGGTTADRPGTITVTSAGEVIVRDRGEGLTPGTETTIFDRFQSSASSTGHGLGLPLARWIARAHGGDLTASNHPDGGAEFLLRTHDGS